MIFLRAEVDRVHEILEEGPSSSTTIKVSLNYAKMKELQKSLEKLIESQKTHKDKSGLGYNPSTEKAKDKGTVEKSITLEKQKSSPQV